MYEEQRKEAYKLLSKIIPNINRPRMDGAKSKSQGFMDLNYDIVELQESGFRIALSHYYKHPSGDMIPDPDMVIEIDPRNQMVTPISYQDSYTYQAVDSGSSKSDDKLVSDLLDFLLMWAKNLAAQGHKFEE